MCRVFLNLLCGNVRYACLFGILELFLACCSGAYFDDGLGFNLFVYSAHECGVAGFEVHVFIAQVEVCVEADDGHVPLQAFCRAECDSVFSADGDGHFVRFGYVVCY